MSEFCSDCENDPTLGPPSRSRWVGPDGEEYCSLHFIHRFGHSEPLVRKEGYESPEEIKPPLYEMPAFVASEVEAAEAEAEEIVA